MPITIRKISGSFFVIIIFSNLDFLRAERFLQKNAGRFSILNVKNPRLKSRASDSPSGFFSLATRLHLPFYLLSCFICPMHCLPAVSYSDSLSASLRWQSYCGAGFLSGLSPRLPRFPEVPLLCYLAISVSGVFVYMWPGLPVAGLTVISEESVCRFVCCRETDNLYPFVLEQLRPNLIYILLSIDISVMPGSTLRAFPFSHTQILNICIFIPAASAGLWWWIPSADFSEILTSTLHLILHHF